MPSTPPALGVLLLRPDSRCRLDVLALKVGPSAQRADFVQRLARRVPAQHVRVLALGPRIVFLERAVFKMCTRSFAALRIGCHSFPRVPTWGGCVLAIRSLHLSHSSTAFLIGSAEKKVRATTRTMGGPNAQWKVRLPVRVSVCHTSARACGQKL